MSGIYGILRRDGAPLDRLDLATMGEILAHRGSDASGCKVMERVGLGQRARHTTPQAHLDTWPMVSSDGDVVLAADVRLDNREDLARKLGILPSALASTGDGALILLAWRRWAEEMPEHLLGDFAIALWDAPRQLLFCVRDRMGVRPFYYHVADGIFAFGTESKALLCLAEVPRELDEMRIASHLLRTFWDRESTFYRSIKRLPPATAMAVTAGSVRTWQYWRLDPDSELILGSDEEYAERFRELFTEAVRCRLRAPDPVGSFLSGGLDSTSVTCVARDLLRAEGRQPVHTFSGVFDTVAECDERPFIQSVVDAGGIVPHMIPVDDMSPLPDLKKLLFHMDEPFFTPHVSMDWALFGAAEAAGVRVNLDGMDGDSAVGHGFGYQTELALSGRLIAFLRAAKLMSESYEVPLRELIWRRGLKPAVPDSVLRRWHLLRRGKLDRTFFNVDFARRIGLDGLDRRFMRLPARSDRQEHFSSLTFDLIPYAIESQNRTAAAFGVEPRHAFFDTRLLEFTLAAPATQKIRGATTRFVLRNALAGILPPPILQRRGKARLGAAFVHKVLAFERSRMQELLVGGGPETPYVDVGRLRQINSRFLADHNLRDGLDLWVVLMLRLGLEHMETGIATTIAERRKDIREGAPGNTL